MSLSRSGIAAFALAIVVSIALQESVNFSLQMPGNAVLFTVLAAIAIHEPAPTRPEMGPPPALP